MSFARLDVFCIFLILYSFSEEYLCSTLRLLSSHLMLAVEDVTCSRDVLGNKQKPLLDTLLNLLESEKESKMVIDLVILTMKIGAQYLLPQPEERVELLLSLLPKTSEELSKSTYGEVCFLKLSIL